MKKKWIAYTLILLASLLCFQVFSISAGYSCDSNTVQICDQNNETEESEIRLGLDDEIIVESVVCPHPLLPSKDCFHPLPDSPLPYISTRLHFPPPNKA